MRTLLNLAVAAALSGAPVIGQEVQTQQTTAGDLVRVFLDCNAHGCDDAFFRTEITWVNFVRDRTVAQVHALVTSEGTGSGGSRFTITFEGLADMAGIRDSLTGITQQGDTQDAVRREVMRVLTLGLARYARTTSAASRLQVTARSAPAGRSASGAEPDRWNLWVYSIGAHLFGNGDDNYGSLNAFGNISARRVSEAWKINLSASFDYSENRYDLTAGSLTTFQRSSGQSVLVVKSLGDHWSTGFSAGTRSSRYSNYTLAVEAYPAIEYDLFPYRESTRRQLIARYAVGIRSFDYDSITIYGKSAETRAAHALLIAGEARQRWGSLSIALDASQYLDDFARRRASLRGGVSWRVVRGLEFNVDGHYEVVRDQLNIPRGTAEDEDILIRLRQLQSGYSYFMSAGLNYTFGSIFNNVVNPRFDR